MRTTLRNLTAAWPLVISLLTPTLTRAETPVPAWVQHYRGRFDYSDKTPAVAVDSRDSVIVTGCSWGLYADYGTIKYSSTGVPLWTNRYNGGVECNDAAVAVAVDADDNVVVTGYSLPWFGGYTFATVKYSSAGVPLWTNREEGLNLDCALAVDGSNNVVVTGVSGLHYVTIKYSSAGALLWINRFRDTGWNQVSQAAAVAVDGSNDVIVTGFSMPRAPFPPALSATIKYSSTGVPLWTNRYQGPGTPDAGPNALAMDGSNNVIVTGQSLGSGSADDYATIKYSSTGAPLWTNRYNGPANDLDGARAVAVDGSDNVIVTGTSAGTNAAPYHYDYATIKYSSAGLPLWTNRYRGPGNGSNIAYAVAVDGGGNVVVTGRSVGSDGSYDYATIKYSSAGLPLWAIRYNGPGNSNDYSTAVAVDGSGSVIVTGRSDGIGSNRDYATIKYTFPLVITDPNLTNGTFQMRLDNVQPGPVIIEASTNLAGWAPVFTNTTPANTLLYTAPDAGNASARFYRAFQFP